MKKAIKILNDMKSKGIVSDYAIGGSIAVMFYTEPFLTKDLDVFIYPQMTESGIVHLSNIHNYLKKLGYKMEGQFYQIEGITVDFVTVYDELTEEALKTAIEKDYAGVKVRVILPEYLLAIALKTGRLKDAVKVEMLCKQAKLNCELLNKLLSKFNLTKEYKKWTK
jgi:hypothetical protein